MDELVGSPAIQASHGKKTSGDMLGFKTMSFLLGSKLVFCGPFGSCGSLDSFANVSKSEIFKDLCLAEYLGPRESGKCFINDKLSKLKSNTGTITVDTAMRVKVKEPNMVYLQKLAFPLQVRLS